MVNRKHCCFQWKGEPIRPIQIGVGHARDLDPPYMPDEAEMNLPHPLASDESHSYHSARTGSE